MRVVSLCSGVGGMDLGLEAAGHELIALCEIDDTCRSVLARHWPHVGCWNDIRTFDGTEWRGRVDLVAGGTPCTDLSVAGRRAGLGGEQSRIFWDFCRIADHSFARWVLWENVAGALSSNAGEDFAAVLWGLTGFRPAVPADGWRTFGMCVGGERAAVWRVLDARWFGVPQRRRRVYVVVGPRGICGPEVLAEPESCGWHPVAGRQAGQVVAALTANGVGAGGGPDDNAAQAGHLVDTVGALGTHGERSGWRLGSDEAAAGQLIPAVTAKWAKGTGGPSGDECQNLVFVKRAHAAVDKDESWEDADVSPTLNGFDNASAVRATVLAFDSNWSSKQYFTAENEDLGTTIKADAPPAISAAAGVRRLTPRECERLMGWPDDWTRWRADGTEIADSGRYRMCGNGVVAGVAEWIGVRLTAYNQAAPAEATPGAVRHSRHNGFRATDSL